MPYCCGQQSLIALYYCILGDVRITTFLELVPCHVFKKRTLVCKLDALSSSGESVERYILSWLWQTELFSVLGPSVSSVYACRFRFCLPWTCCCLGLNWFCHSFYCNFYGTFCDIACWQDSLLGTCRGNYWHWLFSDREIKWLPPHHITCEGEQIHFPKHDVLV